MKKKGFPSKDTGALHFVSSPEPSSTSTPSGPQQTFTTAASASASASSSATTRLDPVSGRNLDGPDLSCLHPSGLILPNPFVIGR